MSSPTSRLTINPLRSIRAHPLFAAVASTAQGRSLTAVAALLIVGMLIAFVELNLPTVPGSVVPSSTASVVAAPTPPLKDAEPPAEYRVEDGDSLLGIAIRFDSTINVLQLANGLDDLDLIQVGQKIGRAHV